jgi:hypothetical protein
MTDVAGFLFDDENEEEMAAHRLTPRRVIQMLENAHTVVPNRRGRRGHYLIVGRDNGGACITVPIEPTRDALVWRPVTAWLSKDYERRWLERSQ